VGRRSVDQSGDSRLFIIGGIGYAVLADLGARRKWRPLTLHSKLMLS
jgi:trk system potassium uptake protein TrkH